MRTLRMPDFRRLTWSAFAAGVLFTGAAAPASAQANRVRIASGLIAGTTIDSGIRLYRGIPYAAPPVDSLRWRAPRPVRPWTGVRRAVQFGPRCMQPPIFADMVFRSSGMSEDCLYLNVWTPPHAAGARLPVLVYFFGGGFVAGDGSEGRYDGERMARRGIVAVTVNYRLGVFGFMAHPDLTRESPHHASGNYALQDQAAALAWVRRNIAAFGGDPAHVTIAGESAGSVSVTAQMVSPLSRDLIAGAIGESGAPLGMTLPVEPLAAAERTGAAFADSAGAGSLAGLRALSSQEVLDAAMRFGLGRFRMAVDGWFLTELPAETFAAGRQAHVPLLVGWNSEEQDASGVLGTAAPTPEAYAAAVRRLYPEHADEVLALYPGGTADEVLASATALASDRWIAFGTWKWADLQHTTGGRPVYVYHYEHPRPIMRAGRVPGGGPVPTPPRGAVHSAEIEYAMGNLDRNRVFIWTPDDYRVSATMQAYFANFIRTGDPNGDGLPAWPARSAGSEPAVMHLDVVTHAAPDVREARYRLLDRLYTSQPSR